MADGQHSLSTQRHISHTEICLIYVSTANHVAKHSLGSASSVDCNLCAMFSLSTSYNDRICQNAASIGDLHHKWTATKPNKYSHNTLPKYISVQIGQRVFLLYIDLSRRPRCRNTDWINIPFRKFLLLYVQQHYTNNSIEPCLHYLLCRNTIRLVKVISLYRFIY